MGTSGAWGGSGGREWGRARRDTGHFTSNPTAARAEQLLPRLGDAMPWLDAESTPTADMGDGSAGGPAANGGSANEPVNATPTPLPLRSTLRRRSHGDGGGGAGGGAGGGGGRRTGANRNNGGGARSRAAVAGVGGRVLAAGLAYQRGDEQTLRSLGLDLSELTTLSSLKRMNVMLNAIVGADGGIAETELRVVNGRVLRAIMRDNLDGAEAVRLYIVETVVQTWASETADASRDSSSPENTKEAERQLRSALTAKTRQLNLPNTLVNTAELRAAIYDSLGLMRKLMRS
jgi:hypothetical protein